MLRLKVIEKNEHWIKFSPLNDHGQSKDFWPVGMAEGTLQLFDIHPVAAAFFEAGKEYEVVIHGKHPNLTPLISPA